MQRQKINKKQTQTDRQTNTHTQTQVQTNRRTDTRSYRHTYTPHSHVQRKGKKRSNLLVGDDYQPTLCLLSPFESPYRFGLYFGMLNCLTIRVELCPDKRFLLFIRKEVSPHIWKQVSPHIWKQF